MNEENVLVNNNIKIIIYYYSISNNPRTVLNGTRAQRKVCTKTESESSARRTVTRPKQLLGRYRDRAVRFSSYPKRFYEIRLLCPPLDY